MKKNIILTVIFTIILLWILDALIDSIFFYKHVPFLDLLIFNVPIHHFYFRLFVIFIISLVGGVFYFKGQKERKLIHINNLILDSLNYPCLIIDHDMNIISINVVAKEIGFVIGKKCWDTFGQQLCLSDEDLQKVKDGDTKDVKCTFCLADICIDNRETVNDNEVHAFDKIWDTYWVPINDHYILHYAIDVTEEREYENKLKKTTCELKERVKELNCISEISKIVEKSSDFLPDIFLKVVDEIHKTFLKPEETCCCINYNSTLFKANCDFPNPKDCIHTKKHNIIRKLKEDIIFKVQLKNSHEFTSEEYNLIDILEERLNKIIERVYLNEALKKNEKLLNSTLNDLLVGVIVHESDTKIIYCNPEAINILGLSYNQMIGKKDIDPIWNFVCEDSTIMEIKDYPINKVISTKNRILNYVLGIKKPNIEYITWVIVNAIPVLLNNGDIDKIVVNFIDITEQKNIEKEKERLREQLYRSKKMEMMGTMAGGVAHDLNNILSGIVTYPEIILMDLPKDHKFRKPIEIIQRSGEKAAAIVGDLITIARGVASEKKPLNINDLIEEYLHCNDYRKILDYNPNVKVKQCLSEDLLFIKASSIHIKKIIMNLVANSMESISDDSYNSIISISTSNVYLEEPIHGYDDINIGEYVLLNITDTGDGISEEDILHIFEPFYSKKEMGKSGTGLGLSIVWNAVQDHNGYIDIKSSSKGTSFKIYFPITRELIKDEINIIENLLGNKEIILVVDDLEDQLDITNYILEKLNYNPVLKLSGEDAIEYIKDNDVDLVLLDIIMHPGINGYETYKQMKEIKSDIKVIITSGYSKTKIINDTIELGAIEFISKPYKIELIGKAIKGALN